MAGSRTIQDQVQHSYDGIAEEYTLWVESHPSPRIRYIDKMLSLLRRSAGEDVGTSKASILELGCGAGVPVTAYLADHVRHIVGNDISEKQLELARKRVPSKSSEGGKVEFAGGDMSKLVFEDDSFDGVVAFFSIFHLPIPAQEKMLRKVFDWLRSGGVLVCSFGAASDGSTVESADGKAAGDTSSANSNSFFNAPMYWANLGTRGTLEMIESAGFEILEWEVLDPTDGKEEMSENDPDAGVDFLWIVARKPIVQLSYDSPSKN